jgi:hypothetical protein
MSYQVRKLDLTRTFSPALAGALIVGLAVAGVGFKMEDIRIVGAGAVIYGIAMLLTAKPVVSVVLAILGFAGGLISFFLMPNADAAGMPGATRLLAVLLFDFLYTILMATLLLVAAGLYNIFVQAGGMEGFSMELGEPETPAQEREEAQA